MPETDENYGTSEAKKSQRYRSLIKLSVVLLLVLALSSIGVAIYLYNNGFVDNNICTTKECVNNAAYLINNMNMHANPCVDFHEFACGHWSNINPMPSDHSGYGAFSKLSNQVYDQVKDTINKLGNAPLLNLLTKFKGWPVLKGDTWKEEDFDFTSTLLHLNKLGIQLDQAKLDMRSKSSFTRNTTSRKYKYTQGYREYTREVAMALGAGLTFAKNEMNDLVEFSIDLAQITLSRSESVMSDNLYNKLTIQQLTSKFPQVFEWETYLTSLFEETGYDVNKRTEVLLYSKDYLGRLVELLQKTPKRIIANYMIWQLVRNTIEYLPNVKLGPISQKFKMVIRGSAHRSPRFKTCISATRRGVLGYAVGRMFVDEYFDKDAKYKADQMVDELKLSIINMMSNSDWMDSSTKRNAIAKAKVMKKNIGYPEEILNDEFLSKSIEVEPNTKAFFSNIIDMMRIETRNSLKEILKPVDKSKWTLNPTVVNARSNEKSNLITFPAGILQPPFYSKDHNMFVKITSRLDQIHRFKAMNFGGIGSVIGHEITHEFDDLGSEYDKDGNMRKWWSKDVKAKYVEKTKCILKQYNAYYVPQIKMHCNGKRTLGENIADIGGLIETYHVRLDKLAYESYVKKHGEELKLPGLNMNNKQVLFLSFAQLWCGEMNDVRYRAKINNAHHSPSKFRVLGPLQNMKEFSEIYNCPLGSPMNPKHKCTLW